jgi:dolichol-phosphate mannosyltransferase
MLASTAPFLAVMDADLQHDEALLPRMLEVLRQDEADLVIGSRYLMGNEVEGWDRRRHGLSRMATRLANTILPVGVTDPMSGFFMLRREVLEAGLHRLSGLGFKILLDLLASLPTSPRIRELPYAFRTRQHGQSKLDNRAGSDFLLLLIDKRIGRWIPARFVLFGAVGSVGVVVHMAVLWLAFQLAGLGFALSQALAALVALTGNFALNNELTYSDRRLRGWGWLRGWLSFACVCGIGALANVGIAAELYRQGIFWPVAALGGILVGAVWNYAMSAVSTWQPKPGR